MKTIKIPLGTKRIVINGVSTEEFPLFAIGECEGIEETGYTPDAEVLERIRVDTSSPTPFDHGEITYYDEHGNVIATYNYEGGAV